MTDFKIGDKVRLTGEGWPKDMLGEVFELYYADSTVGRFRFEALNWYVNLVDAECKYSGELVEHVSGAVKHPSHYMHPVVLSA